MRTYKTITKTSTFKHLDEIRCDLCSAVGEGAEWERGAWKVNDITIEMTVHQREGQNYHDGGSGTEYTIDLCPDCFKNRLIPWLREQGADIEEQEWDW
jgi:hypothetical protein